MNRTEPDLGPAFGAAAGASRERAPEHADLDALTAYLHGSLSEADAEALREHLTGCRECGDLLLELEAFEIDVAEAAQGATTASDLEEAASWRAVRGEVLAAGNGGGGRTGWRVPGAAAAVLAAALVGALGWGIYQRAEIAELIAPQPNLPIVELMEERVQRGAEVHGTEPLDIPPSAEFAVNILPKLAEEGARYRVVIEEPGGATLGSYELVGGAYGYLSLGLSRRLLAGREYTVRVVPLDDGESETFHLRFAR